MRPVLIGIGVLLIVGGLAKGILYYVAFERLPEATFQVWSDAQQQVQGVTSEMTAPLDNAVGELGVDVPNRPSPTAPSGPSAAMRQQFEAIAHDLALLCLLQYIVMGVAAGSVLFGLARVIALLEARAIPSGYPSVAQPVTRKY